MLGGASRISNLGRHQPTNLHSAAVRAPPTLGANSSPPSAHSPPVGDRGRFTGHVDELDAVRNTTVAKAISRQASGLATIVAAVLHPHRSKTGSTANQSDGVLGVPGLINQGLPAHGPRGSPQDHRPCDQSGGFHHQTGQALSPMTGSLRSGFLSEIIGIYPPRGWFVSRPHIPIHPPQAHRPPVAAAKTESRIVKKPQPDLDTCGLQNLVVPTRQRHRPDEQ